MARNASQAIPLDAATCATNGSQPVSAADDDDFPDYEDDDEDRTCPACGGDGGDPMNDYVLPCEYCDGEGRIR